MLRVNTKPCPHCGQTMQVSAAEGLSKFARRKFCSVKCRGQSQVAQRSVRFWKRVERAGLDDCWPWMGRRTPRGYGEFGTAERPERAHRYALMLSGVDVPAGMVVMHLCDNPPCCNPRHLKVGTNLENNRDMIAKGRARYLAGDAHPKAKISEADKSDIVARRGENQRTIADDYGVTKSTICRVQRAALCE